MPLAMMTAVLHVFPDTNLFLQCKSLEEVDWTLLGDWEQIDIIVCAPVVEELDSLKAKGNTRQASRARSANTLLGRLLEEDSEFLAIKNKPSVRLSVRVDLGPDPGASAKLPKTRDNELVCTALGYHRDNPQESVRLLTNDNGPMFSAKRVGLPYIKVPPQWLLPPEQDEGDKREAALRARVAQLEKSEPSFQTTFSGHTGSRFEASLLVYEALTSTEIASLVARLLERFPIATDFGPRELQERPVKDDAFATALYGASKEVFTPATDKEIEKYREAYARWKDTCEERLSKLHKALNSEVKWPLLTAIVTNTGSRPADDALVVIEVQGQLLLMPPPKKNDDEAIPATHEKTSLPRPPSAPKGIWKKVRSSSGLMNFHEQMAGVRSAFPSSLLDHVHTPRLFPPESRDPNAFYWKEGRNGRPAKRVELTCKQWRHARPAEDFAQYILCPLKAGEYAGLITVSVHAANLSQPAVSNLPILITQTPVSCQGQATRLIEEL